MAPKEQTPIAKTKRVKPAQYKSFRMRKRIKSAGAPLSSTYQLSKRTILHIGASWHVFAGITLVYALLLSLFVQGQAGSSISDLKATVQETPGAATDPVGISVSVFGLLLGSASSGNTEVASLYQTIIIIVCSLAFMWALRNSQSAMTIRSGIKQAFYKGMHPLVPFIMVMVVIALQLTPLLLSSVIYSNIVAGGVATTAVEQVVWVILICLMCILSFYLLSSSIFGLIIVTLPNMEPLKSLRSARELVRHRRAEIMRKFVLLGFVLLVVTAALVIPLIAVLPDLASMVFLMCSVAVLPIILTYTYEIYRELL